VLDFYILILMRSPLWSCQPQRQRRSLGLKFFERTVAWNFPRVLQNHERLRALATEHRERVTVFSAHDPSEFDRLVARAAAA